MDSLAPTSTFALIHLKKLAVFLDRVIVLVNLVVRVLLIPVIFLIWFRTSSSRSSMSTTLIVATSIGPRRLIMQKCAGALLKLVTLVAKLARPISSILIKTWFAPTVGAIGRLITHVWRLTLTWRLIMQKCADALLVFVALVAKLAGSLRLILWLHRSYINYSHCQWIFDQ